MSNIKLIEEELLELEQENELLKGKLEKNLAREKYILSNLCIAKHNSFTAGNIVGFMDFPNEERDFVLITSITGLNRQIADIGIRLNEKMFVGKFYNANAFNKDEEIQYLYDYSYDNVLTRLKVLLNENNIMVKW